MHTKNLQSLIPYKNKKQKSKKISTASKITSSTNDLQTSQNPDYDLLSSGDQRRDPHKPCGPSEKSSPPEVKRNQKGQPGVMVRPPLRACDSVNSSTMPTPLPYLAATSSLLPALGTGIATESKASEWDRNKNCSIPDFKVNFWARVTKIGGERNGRSGEERHCPVKLLKGKSRPKKAPTLKAVSLQANRSTPSAKFQSRPEMYTPWSLLEFGDVRGGSYSTKASSSRKVRRSIGTQKALQEKDASLIKDVQANYVPNKVDEKAMGCMLIQTDCESYDQKDENAEMKDSEFSPKANIARTAKKHNEDERGEQDEKSRKCLALDLEENKTRQVNELEIISSFIAKDYACKNECSPDNFSSSSEWLYRSSPEEMVPDYGFNRNQFRASSDHDFILNFMSRRQRSSILNRNIGPENQNKSSAYSTSAAGSCGVANGRESFFQLSNSQPFDTTHMTALEESETENVLFEKSLQDMATKNTERQPKAATKLCSEETSWELCRATSPLCRQRLRKQVACAEEESDFCISSNAVCSTSCKSGSELLLKKTSTTETLIQELESERFTSIEEQERFSQGNNCFEKLKISLTTSYEKVGQSRRAECGLKEVQYCQHESDRQDQFSGRKFHVDEANDEDGPFGKAKFFREADQNSSDVPYDEQCPVKKDECNSEVHTMSDDEDHKSTAQENKVSQAMTGNQNDTKGCEKQRDGQGHDSQETYRASQSKLKEPDMVNQSEAYNQDNSAKCLSKSHITQHRKKLEICKRGETTKKKDDTKSNNPGREEEQTSHVGTVEKELTNKADGHHKRISLRGQNGDGQTTPLAGTPVSNERGPGRTSSEFRNGDLSHIRIGGTSGQVNCTTSISTQSVHSSSKSYCNVGEARRLQKLALPNGYSPWIRPSGMLPRVGAESPAVCGDPEIQSYHEQLSSSLQTFQPRTWRPLTPDLVRRPTEPCHRNSGGRCRLRKVRPTTASIGHVTPKQVISRTGSAKHLPHRPDTPRVGQGDYDTLSPNVISELIFDTRPNTPTATYGASRKGRQNRSTSAPRNRSPRVEPLDTDFAASSDEDECKEDLSDNDSLSDLERGSEPLVDRNRKAPDIRLRPDDPDNMYIPPSKKDMRRFDFDAEKNVPPEYEFWCPVPGELYRISLRHCAVNKVDWRCSGYAANICDPLNQDFMDRLVEMERHQLNTRIWEAKRSKRQRKKTQNSRRNMPRQRDKRCCQLCLQAACLGDCALKRVKPNICDNCRQQFCTGECSETAYDQRMRAPREDTHEVASPNAPGARACKTCQGHNNARAINSSYAELGRPTSAMLTFSRGQGSSSVIRRPSSVDCAPSAANKSKRLTRQPKRSRGHNGLLPDKKALYNLTTSIAELSLMQY